MEHKIYDRLDISVSKMFMVPNFKKGSIMEPRNSSTITRERFRGCQDSKLITRNPSKLIKKWGSLEHRMAASTLSRDGVPTRCTELLIWNSTENLGALASKDIRGEVRWDCRNIYKFGLKKHLLPQRASLFRLFGRSRWQV